MAWYLPVLLLTIFRPNLEDRVAISAWAKAGWANAACSSAIKPLSRPPALQFERHCSGWSGHDPCVFGKHAHDERGHGTKLPSHSAGHQVSNALRI